MPLADTFLGDASLRFGSDPDVLLAYGTLLESAAFRTSADLGGILGSANSLYRDQTNRQSLLSDARRVLGRALDAARESDEARLRLAHARIQTRDDRGARTLLEQIGSLHPSADVAYLTAMMLGGIRTREGAPAGAATLFQQASRLNPAAQSAYIAQAQALRLAGQPRDSVEALRKMLLRPTRARDPWARYPFGLDETRASLDALRGAVKEPSPPGTPEAPPAAAVTGSPGATFDLPQTAGPPDRVELDVLVTKNHRPVLGLTAADFDVRHDGERQQIAVADIQSTPVDVRMLIDTGNGLAGDRAARVKDAARTVIDRLRPGDRGEVLAFSEEITLVAGLTSDRAHLNAAVDRLATASGAALVDAAFVSLALPASPDRRTVSLIFTAGLDTSSWLLPPAVVETAAGAAVTVYGVIVPEPDLPLRQAVPDAGRLRNVLFDHPALLRNAFLPVLADDTGGEILNAATDADLPATFTDVLTRFQQRYRLTYTPAAREKRGVQTIDVQMKDKALTVVAKKTFSTLAPRQSTTRSSDARR
jgi:VWFA-related protein